MEREFLVTQLTVLLEKRAAQHRVCRQNLPAGLYIAGALSGQQLLNASLR